MGTIPLNTHDDLNRNKSHELRNSPTKLHKNNLYLVYIFQSELSGSPWTYAESVNWYSSLLFLTRDIRWISKLIQFPVSVIYNTRSRNWTETFYWLLFIDDIYWTPVVPRFLQVYFDQVPIIIGNFKIIRNRLQMSSTWVTS